MEDNDIFAPPTSEELDLFAAPTEEELSVSEKTVEQISPLSAGLEGAAQGATFGLAEEITAPFVAGAGMMQGLPQLPGESKLEQAKRLMQTYRDVARERTKLAEEQQPLPFTGGAMAGGVLLPGSAALQGSNAISQIARGALVGAAGGAATGLGVAEGSLEERLPAAMDMSQTGAAIGAVIPGGVVAAKGLASGARAAKKAISESDIGKIYKAYANGEDLLADFVKNFQNMKDLGGKVTSNLVSKYRNLSKDLTNEFDRLEKSGTIIDIAPVLEKRRQELTTLIDSRNPDVAKNAQKAIDILDNYLYGKEAVKLIPKVSSAEKQLKEYQDVLNKMQKLQSKRLKSGLSDQEEIALNKLQQTKAQAEATQGLEAMDTPKLYQSIEGKKVITQELAKESGGEITGKTISQNIKGVDLTPIEEAIDPATGSKILSFKNEATGEVFSEIIPEGTDLTSALKAIKVRTNPKTKLTPKELKEAEDALKEFTPVEGGLSLPQSVSKAVSGLVDDIREMRPEEIKSILSSQSDIRSKYTSLTGKELPEVLSAAEQETIRENLSKLLMQFDPELVKKGKLPDILEGFKSIKDQKAIPGLKQVAPDVVELLEKEAPGLAEKIRLGLKLDPNELKTISPDVRAQLAAIAGGGASLVAKGAAKAGSVSKNLGEKSKAFIERDPAYLATIANKVKSVGSAGAGLANVIMKAIDKEPRARNAILYSIMQNPAYREMIRNAEGVTEDGK